MIAIQPLPTTSVIHYSYRPIGRGGLGGGGGVHSNSPFGILKIFDIHRLTAHFKCPTIRKWSTSLAAIEKHCCPNESGCSSANLLMEDECGMQA